VDVIFSGAGRSGAHRWDGGGTWPGARPLTGAPAGRASSDCRATGGRGAARPERLTRAGKIATRCESEEGGATTCGDVFAGIGGMSLGLERAGFTVRWQVEVDPYCETILARHWPAIPRRRDVRFAGRTSLERVDLIAGGFPCQDVSIAGKGAGLAGHRSGLWHAFARLVGELRPRWVLVENVPALRGRGADTVLGDLEAAGYAAWPCVVGARHVGAPHRRDRVWIVGRVADAGYGRRHQGGESTMLGDGAPPEWLQDVGQSRHADGASRVADPGGDTLWEQPRGRGGASRPGARFPAAPREQQHEWEAPRTVESRMGGATHGISARLARTRWRNELRALGNAVVPQVVEAIGRAILAVDATP
jgi:DNA (cytosine-5)-methyltransferase 1